MKFDYDEDVDVLYVTFFKEPKPSYGRELDIPGLWAVGMYDIETNEPTGVTFICFKELLVKLIKTTIVE